MADNEAGGSASASGSADKDKQEMEVIVWQINLDAERYNKSIDNLMKKILDDEKAELDLARSVELDKKRLVDYLAPLSKWVMEESDEIDKRTKLRQVREIKITIKKLIGCLKMHSKRYKDATKARMGENKEQMEDIRSTLHGAFEKLSETARHLTAKRDKKDP